MKRALAAVRRVWTAAREVLAEQWEARLVEVPSDPAADARSSADARRVMERSREVEQTVAALIQIDVEPWQAIRLAECLDRLDQEKAARAAAARAELRAISPDGEW